ncbi:MAG TPA: VCBS repeat-containing protein, partial [Gemmataceae bacterium]|nr:VCBS repeat-containing protein [Gemmataceae bacterium]
SADGMGRNQLDFYSVASHELGHLLGIGTAPAWFAQVSGGTFHGPNAQAIYGGPVPVYADSAHWADGITINGQPVAMDPIASLGIRVSFSSLDYAGLADLGWSVSATPTSPPVVPPPPPPPPVVVPPLGNPGTKPVILTGPADGSAQAFVMTADGQLTPVGGRMVPFPGFTGVIRATVADFNGDGTADYAFATGAGTNARVRVIDGKTGGDLAGPTFVLDGFGGGVFLAAGDVDQDGKAELAVSADAGGGTRVSLYKIDGSGLNRVADFLAFGDPNFRGGSRVALGDVNRDGAADLVVGAGIGGGPRVAIYSGNRLLSGRADKLVPDFFALDPNLRSGVFVTTADLDGDGYSDVIYSTGNTGGPRVRVVGGATLTANPGRDAYFLPAMADFFALDPNDRNGLRIAARDLNGDGKAELIIGGGDRANPVVRVFSWPNLGSPSTQYLDPFADTPLIDGVYVG